MSGPFGELPRLVGERLGRRVTGTVRVAGGDVAQAFRMTLDDGRSVFVKRRPGAPEGMFAAEAAGLAWLGETATVRVPAVLAVADAGPGVGGTADEGVGGDPAPERFLVLAWIDHGRPAPDRDERLGRALAELHRFPVVGFGLDRDNTIGPLPQHNRPLPTWAEFYATRRLEPLLRRAVDDEALPTEAATLLERLVSRLPELCGPPEPPSRLHGDLWSGNVLTGPDGGPWLVDPAAYGGHREVDLAMMRLFGGFGGEAFLAYDEVHPLAPGHGERVALWQLYPLLVHTLLFGGGYGSSALATLRRYA